MVENSNKFLLVKGITGLGDRMLCAAGAMLYARLTGRGLLIDWRDPYYSSDGANVFHRLFTSPVCSPTAGIPITDSVYPALWRGRLDQHAIDIVRAGKYTPARIRRELSIDLGMLNYPEDVLVMVEFNAAIDPMRPYFNGAFAELASMPSDRVAGKVLRNDLLPRPEIRARVDRFRRERFHGRTVGVHIRYSDYRVRIFAIIKQLNALLRRQGDLQIFLATDNLAVKEMLENNYARVISTPHWYAEPGAPIHNNFDGPDRTESAIEALIDIYLLANCDYLIFDGASSFSRVASLLSDAPAENKFDVDPSGVGKKRRWHANVTRMLRGARLTSWGFRILPKLVSIRRL